MLIRYGYEITVFCQQPTAMVTLLGLRDGRERQVRIGESFFTSPQIDTSTYRDLFDNVCRRFVAPAGALTLWSDSVIEDSGAVDPVALDAQLHPVADLPDDCLAYLMGSRYCETDRLSQIAWDKFGHIQRGWARTQAVCDFVHGHIAFNYKTASSTRTAYEVYEGRVGVCRDYAHLAVALCRCLNIPARYVNGYLGDIGVPRVDPMDFSAWMEVYLGGKWWTFDPRNNIPRIGRIVIAHGRDAADVAMLTSFGLHQLNGFRVWAYETDAGGLPGAIVDTTGAAGREVRARSPL
ncbi:transglutaminase-like domain-containing protein [Caulobacter sp. RL271]|jgi:transglutaminase-like putative cysteine protease|uniref:Transglutaminase family protein n=1 Tax=Caulobacter segnis TaxID=88688 RepID=A0ABY4ZNJ3_9CAUL|nr:transglutaminase family protein [Caulobacter segnis]USQ94174.1 transglutaminase family protein [Caulobacter segnis]